MTVAHIEQAALAVAEARAHAERADAALAEADAGRARIAKRIEDLTAERRAIVAAERSGSSGANAALRLAIVDEDIADLKSLLGAADVELAKPKNEAAQAQQRAANAEWQLSNARDLELEARLIEYTARLDILALEALRELSAVGQRLGRARPIWAPSHDLVNQLQRLRAIANGIQR